MKVPMFRIVISYDDEKKLFVPEIETTEVGEKLDRREQVEIIEQCVNVITKAIKSCRDKANQKEGASYGH